MVAPSALIDWELYLPCRWCDDPARREEAGIEVGVGFATKRALGLRMVERAVAAGLPARWVTADDAYGQDSKFRTWLQQQRIGYVLAVPRNHRVPITAGNSRPEFSSRRLWRGSVAAAVTAPKGHGSTTGPWPLCPAPSTDTGIGC